MRLDPRTTALVAVIVAAAASRLLPHPPNFTALPAMALFGGAMFTRLRTAIAAPLAAMLLSDLALAAFVYDWSAFGQMPLVYLAFAATTLLGRALRARISPVTVLAGAVGTTALHFGLSNFGVWITGSLYPVTWSGLLTCYVAAIPFVRTALLANLLFGSLLFGGFALAERVCPALRDESAEA